MTSSTKALGSLRGQELVERCANGDQADTVAAADFTRPAHLLSLVYETDSASYVRGASFPDLGPF